MIEACLNMVGHLTFRLILIILSMPSTNCKYRGKLSQLQLSIIIISKNSGHAWYGSQSINISRYISRVSIAFPIIPSDIIFGSQLPLDLPLIGFTIVDPPETRRARNLGLSPAIHQSPGESRAARANGHWSRNQSREFVTELEGELLSVLREAVRLFIASYPPPHRLQKEILSRSPSSSSLPPPPPPSASPSSYVRARYGRKCACVCLLLGSAKAQRKRLSMMVAAHDAENIFTFRNENQPLAKKITRLLRETEPLFPLAPSPLFPFCHLIIFIVSISFNF